VADHSIPRPTKFGGMTVWDEDEVDECIEAKLAERDHGEAA
jgi:predicted DNA-binding transcriptional regulator AlpA